MRIAELVIENYKGFKGEHKFDLDSNLVFIVGENNTGKSTLFEAINTLQNGFKDIKKIKNVNSNSSENLKIQVKLKGDITEAINYFSQNKYLNYVFEENGEEILIIRRQTEETQWIDSKGAEKIITSKNIAIWNPEKKIFENPAGIDSAFKTLFESQYIWADTNPDEISDFSNTKICGRLINAVAGDFFLSEMWKNFEEVHRSTFADRANNDSLISKVSILENDIREIMEEQYGKSSISFNFSLPEHTSFLKLGDILLDDGVETSQSEKGNGMKRALALALIQVYSKSLIKHDEDESAKKPLFFMLDEPETFLHPKAQERLILSLKRISFTNQIFITTHSPYLVKYFCKDNHKLLVFSKEDSSNQFVNISNELSLFSDYSPTWGEINYYAYNICWPEFHDELYGHIQHKTHMFTIKEVDEYLTANYGIEKSKQWIRDRNGKLIYEQITIGSFIRNFIHHPENRYNQPYTQEELESSTRELINIVKHL